jgi:diguanylate cyclase (GGDEF)-like protein/PAS domain S-box-containing protein
MQQGAQILPLFSAHEALSDVGPADATELARATLDSIGNAIISCDRRGRVAYLNAAAQSLTGWSAARAGGRAASEIVHLVDAVTQLTLPSPMMQALRCATPAGTPATCLLRQPNGAECHIEFSAARILDRRGRLIGAVMMFQDVSQARAHTRQLSFLAQHDALTGLPNRVLLQDRLTQALALTRRHAQQPLAILLLDVDHFKCINDTLGHAVGDLSLQWVAEQLLGCVRNTDTVSRLGGDEFVILLTEVDQARAATTVAAKMLRALRAPLPSSSHAVHVTASIGIAVFPDDGADAPTLLHHADLAMYEAKSNGRDGYQRYRPQMLLGLAPHLAFQKSPRSDPSSRPLP